MCVCVCRGCTKAPVGLPHLAPLAPPTSCLVPGLPWGIPIDGGNGELSAHMNERLSRSFQWENLLPTLQSLNFGWLDRNQYISSSSASLTPTPTHMLCSEAPGNCGSSLLRFRFLAGPTP